MTEICGHRWAWYCMNGRGCLAVCLLAPGHRPPHEGPHFCCWAWTDQAENDDNNDPPE